MKNTKTIWWIIIFLVIAILLWWFFVRGGTELIAPGDSMPSETVTPPLSSQDQKLLNQSSSDDVQAIQSDLSNTDLNTIDKELEDIEKAIQ